MKLKVFIVGLLLVFLFNLALAQQAASLPSGQKELTTSADSSQTQNQDTLGQWVEISSIAVGVFTLGLLLVAGLQVRWTKKTLRSMEDTSRRQLRAYITLLYRDPSGNPLHLIPPTNPKDCISAICKIKNTGQTPAYSVVSQGAIECFEYPQSKNWVPHVTNRTIPTSNTTLGPGETSEITISSKGPLVLQLSNDIATYVYGRIEYRDAFGYNRFTNFCFIVLVVNGKWATYAAPAGNDAD